MGKYDPLTHFLASKDTAEVPMTFDEIERVIGAPLPPSKRYPAWWSNNPSNNVMTRAWLAAGYQTERVDVGHGQLIFRKVSGEPAAERDPDSVLERIWARLGGTVFIPPGVDITAPTGEVWDAETQ